MCKCLLLFQSNCVIPVEVKAGEDRHAASFKAFLRDRQPATAIRFSRRGYRVDDGITNLPLYLAGKTSELIG